MNRSEWLLPGVAIPVPDRGAVVDMLPVAMSALASTRRSILRPPSDALRPVQDGCGELLRRSARRCRPRRPTGERLAAKGRKGADSVSDGSEKPWAGAEEEDGLSDGTDSTGAGSGEGEAIGVPDDDEPKDLSVVVPLGYRTVTFEVDSGWLSDYLSDFALMYDGDRVDPTASYGMVSSTKDALDAVWSEFRTARKGSHETFHKLIGCYNLPREPSPNNATLSSGAAGARSWDADKKPDLFWHLHWGPAHKVLMYALQLIYTYPEYLEGDQISTLCTDSGTVPDSGRWKDDGCTYGGLRDFVTKVLGGHKATNKGCQMCSLTINLRNADAGYDVVNEPCVTADTPCDGGYKPEERGANWNTYYLYWVGEYLCLSGHSASSGTCGPPDEATGSSASTVPKLFSVTTHPIHLHFRGAVCDYILFLSRLALDLSLHGDLEPLEALALRVKCIRIARYALRIISSFSELLVHEISHVYLAAEGEDKHCNYDSCMSVAGQQFGCKVRGKLGLPRRVYSRVYVYSKAGRTDTTEDDWDPSDHVELQRPAEHYDGWQSCDTISEGVPGEDATFCSTGCFDYRDGAELYNKVDQFVACSGEVWW